MKLFEGGDLGVDAAGDQAELTPLLEEIDAKSALALADAMSEIGAAHFFKKIPRPLHEDRLHELVKLVVFDRLRTEMTDHVADARHGGQSGRQMEVGALVLHHQAKELVDRGLPFDPGRQPPIL